MTRAPGAARGTRVFGPDLRARVFSGVVLVVLGLVALVLGGVPLALWVGTGVGLMLWELWRMALGRDGAPTDRCLVFAAAAVPSLVAAFVSLATAIVLAAVLSGVLTLRLPEGARRSVTLGAFVLGAAGALFVSLRGIEAKGLAIALWIPFVVAFSDMGGYFAGRAIGGAKLAPSLSPNKTWAGAVGGLVLAALASFGFAFVVGGSVFALTVLGALAAVVAQAGDLFESGLKRRFGVKDSSGIIPGHGGVMDRFDGVTAATLLVGGLLAIVPGLVSAW